MNSRLPTIDEMNNLVNIYKEWLNDNKSSKYRKNDGRLITMEQFYNLHSFKKVALGTWKRRLNRLSNRKNRIPNIDEAIELLMPWGVVDRAVGILYRWTHKRSGFVYIGITTENLEERTRGHLRTVQRGKYPKGGLHYAIAQDGFNAFEICELNRFSDLSKLAFAEKKAIDDYNCISPNGYNLTEGGKGITLKKIPITFRGKNFKNLKALSDEYDQPVDRINSRLILGWTLEEAVDLARNMPKDSPYRKITNFPISQLAKKQGLRPSKVYSRIKVLGWTIDEALEIVSRKNKYSKNNLK